MSAGLDQILTQNISAIVMAGAFLWYLAKRDKSIEDAFYKFSDKLDRLSGVISSLENRLASVEKERKKRDKGN